MRYYNKNSAYLLYGIFIGLASFSCSNKQEIVYAKGFILYFDLNHFYFVPTNSGDIDCYTSFATNNLGGGMQFNIASDKILRTVSASVDTFKVENIDDSMAPDFKYLKIKPFKIRYKYKDGTSNVAESREVLGVKINSSYAEFHYTSNRIDLIEVSPIDCEN